MKTTILLKKFKIEEKEFVTTKEIRTYCNKFGFDHANVIRYYSRRGYFVRLFKGIFYIRHPEDIREGRSRYNHMELVAHGLRLKGVKNWYFGLHTALKLNNLTHEYFVIDEIINDVLSRPDPVTIDNHKFRFVKTSRLDTDLGVIKDGVIRYSDPEKTVADFVYIWKSHGMPDKKIISDVSEWAEGVSGNKLKEYSKRYPKSVMNIVEEIA